MKDEPLLDTDLMGKVKKNAKLPLIWAEMQNVWKYLNAFGMTPSARSGLHVEKKQDDHDLWAQFAEMTKARKEALKK
jgi:phage terminase small subunit